MGVTLSEVVRKTGNSGIVGWDWIKRVLSRVKVRQKERRLRLGETISLGDRRFLAVIYWQHETFLVGVTPQNITLVATPSENKRKSQEFAWESGGVSNG